MSDDSKLGLERMGFIGLAIHQKCWLTTELFPLTRINFIILN